MYVSMSRLRVPETDVPELLAAFGARAGLVDDAEGFAGLEVWHSDRDAGEVIMVSRWQSREAFTRYMRSDAHRISHERISPALQAVIKLERLDHLHTYDVVAT
jgi:heme-degrading monooxygenase HmoA